MAIYHFSAKVIGRTGGRSAVAAAAYRSASLLEDEHLHRRYDFTAKAGVVHSEILLPDGAPEQFADRATLWNTVEAGERRKDAQLARDIEIALPRELSQAEAIALVRDFVCEQFVSRGMVADLNVHWGQTASGDAQPHAHVMLTLRSVGADGFGPKDRSWNGTALLNSWRERWAEMANERLAEMGHDARIDHRSYAAQGMVLEPQGKIGPAGSRREARGEDAERAAEHAALARRNGERLAADPEIALVALTQQHSTFTRRDLARFVDRHSADATQFTQVLARVEASPELVRLGVDGRGQERLSTRSMLACEQGLEATAQTLAGRDGHGVLEVARERAMRAAGLGDEQRLAVCHVTAASDVSVVVGYAGTGKSTMLGAARQAWEASGYRVRGAALSGIAAEGLEAGSGIESRTLASLEHGWAAGRDALTAGDVLVVDEAGMVGSRQLARVLEAASSAGAKVVLVGDPEQLQAIEAGGAFRAVAERGGSVEITAVRRQRAAWQQAATRELATGATEAALARYETAGMVSGHATGEAARAALVTGWDAARQSQPGASQIMLAHRRADVRALNEQARAVRRAAGELGPERVLATAGGDRAFAAGDRVYFLRNERGLGVKNGTLGTLVGFEGTDGLRVRLDGPGGSASGAAGREVAFSLREYAQIEHGYAATVHKSQGVTVDRAHVLATESMDRHMAYVGLTRHRDRVDVHWSAEEFGTRARLGQVLGRERLKDTSLDYGLAYGARRGLRGPGDEAASLERAPEREAGLPGERPSRPAGMFAGLRLKGGSAPEPVSWSQAGQGELERAVERYARAWSAAERMRQHELPVLAQQQHALQAAGSALDAVRAEGVRDLARALRHQPGVREAMTGREGRERTTRLVAALQEEARVERDPQRRAERVAAEQRQTSEGLRRGRGLGLGR